MEYINLLWNSRTKPRSARVHRTDEGKGVEDERTKKQPSWQQTANKTQRNESIGNCRLVIDNGAIVKEKRQ